MKKRNKFTLSHYRMHTCDMGELIPVSCIPVLPGDTIQHHTSALIRVSPLNSPVMHPVQIRLHHFFVPNRIIWPESENGGWEQFITGGPDGANAATPPVQLSGTNKKRLNQYLGVPPLTSGSTEINGMPLRAFNKIWNEFYRDQDLAEERDESDTIVPRCAWEKDYFSTARPFTQKGPQVTIPVGDTAPVIPDPTKNLSVPTFQNTVGTNAGRLTDGTGPESAGFEEDATGTIWWNDPGLIADLSATSAIDVNQFRASFAIQRYQEARARYGSRFTEYLRYLGITPSDARLQRPEFLGGGTARLSFSEVLQTTPGAEGENGVGDLYGHGIAGARTNAYRKFFEEHGYIITCFSARPKATYLNGAHREFFKKSKEDYYQQELVHLGQQEVLNQELHIEHDDPSGTFGFQDRYNEYRSHPSFVGQDFRDLLDTWHLGRDLPTNVALNENFIECQPSKRIFQVGTDDTLWCMFNHHVVARRLLPKRAYPRVL